MEKEAIMMAVNKNSNSIIYKLDCVSFCRSLISIFMATRIFAFRSLRHWVTSSDVDPNRAANSLLCLAASVTWKLKSICANLGIRLLKGDQHVEC
eukprot:142249-Ditylum_brightwellii.AAC.1